MISPPADNTDESGEGEKNPNEQQGSILGQRNRSHAAAPAIDDTLSEQDSPARKIRRLEGSFPADSVPSRDFR